MMNHPPIPISELAEHTELLKANDNLKLSQEYEVSRNKVQRSSGIDFCLIVFSIENDMCGSLPFCYIATFSFPFFSFTSAC